MTNNQLYIFLIYIASGMVIGIFFDMFRVLRKSMKTSNLITYIEDTIFWIIVGLFLIWEIFTISYGELRSYIFIGLFIGFVIYMLSVSKYFIKINVKIMTYVKKIILKILNILKNIYNFLLKIFKPVFHFIENKVKLNINFFKQFKRNKKNEF